MMYKASKENIKKVPIFHFWYALLLCISSADYLYIINSKNVYQIIQSFSKWKITIYLLKWDEDWKCHCKMSLILNIRHIYLIVFHIFVFEEVNIAQLIFLIWLPFWNTSNRIFLLSLGMWYHSLPFHHLHLFVLAVNIVVILVIYHCSALFHNSLFSDPKSYSLFKRSFGIFVLMFHVHCL